MKERVFRDPVHGLIELRGENRLFGAVLDTRAFQRLRRIHQMGFAWLVYPGAEHSRFGHALGAFHLAGRVVKSLELKPEVALHVKAAALLHDIGHGPFSHSWEQVFPGTSHEEWGARLVSENQELNAALNQLEAGLAEKICGFWDKSYRPGFARKLVSSQLDVDRLDYLQRDGHYSGAGYASFDLDWILHALRLDSIGTGDDNRELVVDYRRGRFAVEQYLFARSYMYAQVYHHKTVRAAEWMFLKLMERFRDCIESGVDIDGLESVQSLITSGEMSADSYLGLEDVAVTATVNRWAGLEGDKGQTSDSVMVDLARRLANRRLFKTLDLGDDPSAIKRIAPELSNALSEASTEVFGEHGKYYFHLDTATQTGYSRRADELHVVGHPVHGTVTLGTLMDELSIGRAVSTVRVVCAPELLKPLREVVEKLLPQKN